MNKKNVGKHIKTYKEFEIRADWMPAKRSGKDRMRIAINPPPGWRAAQVLSYTHKLHVLFEK
ncbi:MAG TPA: hypothetical protein DD706_24410 [Nitrospiraceae bacterium]|nr:hypothetical protein [Nitrospiraceae bacterium]